MASYTKTTWNAGDPITQSNMNKIEQGISDAFSEMVNNYAPLTAFNSFQTSTQNGIASAQSTADSALSTANTAYAAAADGTAAMTQIHGAMEYDPETGVPRYSNIANRFSQDESSISNANTTAARVQGWIQAAQAIGGQVYDEENQRFKTAESLAERIGEINRLIANAQTTADSTAQIVTPTNGRSFGDRLTSLDANTTPSMTVPAIITEISNARGTNNAGGDNNSLSDRFIQDETRLSAIDGDTTPSRTLPNVITEINNAHRTTEDTLDARFDSIDGGATPSRTLPNIITEINDAHRSTVSNDTLNQRFNSIDSGLSTIENSIGSGFDTTNTIAARFDAIDNVSTGSIAGLNTRISALETEVDMTSANSRIDLVETEMTNARTSSVIRTPGENDGDPDTDTTYTSLDARLEAIETAAAAVKTDVSTIANELAMVDGTVIVNTNTRIDTIDADLNTATTGIKARLDAIDNASTGTIKALDGRLDTIESDLNTATTGLKAKVAALESKNSTYTEIIHNATYDSNDKPQISNPSENVDYLIKGAGADNKYYYWKYIKTSSNPDTYSWELISGASGGSGTSSAEFYANFEAIEGDPSETVDYFIGSNGHYIHYRHLNGQWVMILPDNLINDVTVDDSTITVGEGAEAITTQKSRPIVRALGSETNLLAKFKAIQSITATPLNGGGYNLAWTDIDGAKVGIDLTGGGGSASLANAAIDRITDANLTKVAGEKSIIEYTYTATDSNGSSIAQTTTAVWYVNNVRVATSDVRVNDLTTNPNDKNSFDITPYLQPGINNIYVSISIIIDGQTYPRTKTWAVDVKNFSLTWNYDESYINNGSTVEFSCTPYGADLTKTLHIIIDNNETTQTVTTSSIPVTVILENNFTHGVHSAEMYMTATINDQVKTSNHVYHDFIVAESDNNTPIIAATLPVVEMNQYDTIEIPFVVYTPNSNTSTVILAIDGVNVDTREVGRTTQKWYFTPSTLGTDIIYENEIPISGTHTLTLTVGSVVKTLIIKTNSVKINNEEISGYAFKLKASELISNAALQAWYYDESNPTTTKLQFSNNFDWINGGLKTELDENGEIRQYIRVKSGTRMTIPYKMFASDPRETGSDFKIIFKVENCRDYDAKILDTVSAGIGIQLNAHNATFQSTTTTVSTQYGEDEYTELEFEVYKATDDNDNPVPGQYMMAWIDGVITTARVYGGDFVQTIGNTSSIVIGSDDCDVCIYLVKYYQKGITINEHIINFIADAPNAGEMIRRYTRNNILDPNDQEIDYQRLIDNNPDCRVWLYEIEKMPTSKDKDFATKVYNFQQFWKNGDKYYQLVGENAKLTIQGTSSVNYRKGAANTDINFGKSGATLHDGYGNDLLADGLEYKGFKINDNSLPITYANTKVNFASCEQVNNMCNAEWYQRYQPFPSLTARDCMEFVMGVQFIKDRGENEDSGEVRLFNEKEHRSDSKYYMYSIANMGTSKKNTHIFHDPNEACIEVMANTSKGQRMLEWPTDLDWSGKVEGKDHSFEIRYVEDENEEAAKIGWKRFIDWMASYNLSPYNAETNPNGYTNAALAEPVEFTPYTFRGHNREITQVEGRNFEQVLRGVTVNQYAGTYTNDTFEYRMAKMLSECEDYMAMDSVVYHFLFIERHTMVDNVAKNTFWSSYKEIGGPNNEEGFWIWDLSKNYDNDTSDGNNNEGQLVFDYGNEATDTYGAKTVFNAADSVWFIFISNLYEACRAMFTNRESKGAWNAKNYHEYLLNEQRKVPERVWNECYWYDYLRTYENNIDTSWITFLDGGQKTHQRKHYETYEELYDASKYMSALSTLNTVNIRGYTPPTGTWSGVEPKTEFQIKMYNKCYLTIHVDDAYKQIKCAKGVNNTISFYNNNDPAQGYTTMNDAVIKMDTAQMIQEIGDLSCLYPGSSSFTSATRLRVLHIGSGAAGYINPNMTSTEQLTFTNPMLEELNVQNLPYATYNLDLSKCPELKRINASGSGFTGFEFANGGLLNEAYINNPVSLIMRNLDYLTNANFHLTTPTAVTSLRLEGGKLFDNYTFINQLTNLGVLRLTNINWTLNTITLLDRLVELMGINESGYTVTQSYLAGNISLTGIVYEGDYDKYTAAWSPDLIIDVSQASQFVQQHLVIYKNENGTELHRRYINHGMNLVDPYYNNFIEAPTKASDIENRYVFGELDFAGDYKEYSGWRLSSDEGSITSTYGDNPTIPVTTALEVIAVFSRVKQQYKVRWLLRENQVVTETVTPQNYGSGYDLASPTIKEVQNAGFQTYTFTPNGDLCTYTIMTGWEKLPTNIAPTEIGGTYDIYATWLERRDVDYNTVLTDSSYSVEEKLLVLREMSAARNTLNLAKIFPITLGYDGIKPAIDLVSSPTRYSNSPQVVDYMPLSANTSFTMMIDYRFEHRTSSTASEAILLSCYDNTGDSDQGFKLFYNPQSSSPVPQISFGSTDTQSTTNIRTIGSTINNRGIVVLRHIAGESTLYIYTGSTENGLTLSYNRSDFRKTATLENSARVTDAKIVLGGTNISNASLMNATGTLYKVKYWEEDLGDGECAQLANWCHETINFAAQDWNGDVQHSARNSTLTANLVLHTMNASEMGTITEGTINPPPSTIGWDPSTVRDFYNSRLYQAFPTMLQSIMKPVTVVHRKGNYNNSQFIIGTGSSTTTDYVFAPSCVELGSGIGQTDDIDTAHSVEANGAFAWYGSNQMHVLHYNNITFEENANHNSASYTNLRFPYRYNPVNNTITIYTDYPSTGSSFYAWAYDHNITLQTGDILIPSTGDVAGNVAYVYVDSTEIGKGAPYIVSTESYLQTSSGGWIPSVRWWTRSVPQAISPTNNACKFIAVSQVGNLTQGNVRFNNGLVYSIAL